MAELMNGKKHTSTFSSFGGSDLIAHLVDKSTGKSRVFYDFRYLRFTETLGSGVDGEVILSLFNEHFSGEGTYDIVIEFIQMHNDKMFSLVRVVEDVEFLTLESVVSIDGYVLEDKFTFAAEKVRTMSYESIKKSKGFQEILDHIMNVNTDVETYLDDPYRRAYEYFIRRAVDEGILEETVLLCLENNFK
jgi:hypothetical protein